MLDAFEIVTSSGIVLWRKHYAPLSPHVINSLINDVFIEDRHVHTASTTAAAAAAASNPASSLAPSADTYRKDKYTLKYATAKDVGLIFVVGKRDTLPASEEDCQYLSTDC